MPRIEIDCDLANADADGLAAANVTLEAGIVLDGALTSGGTFTSADGMGRILIIVDAGTDDQSAATFNVTGTDANDQVLTEAITGPVADATVVSTKFFKTVSSITVSGTVDETDVVNIGTRGTTLAARSKAVPLNYQNREAAMVALDITGTCNVDVLETFDDLFASTTAVQDANWVVQQSGKTADQSAQLSKGATGVMLEVNTYTDSAEIQMMVHQLNN